MDPVKLTELMQRTENIEMILQEISAVRPFTVAVVLLVFQFIGTVVIALVGWFGRGFLGAYEAHQAKQDEINQQLLLIPGEVKKSYETTVAEIKARSESLDDILKEVRATQAAVSAVELLYDADRLMNERRYEFAMTTLTQLIEALHISLHNHKLIDIYEENLYTNLHYPSLSLNEGTAGQFATLRAECDAQKRIINAMISRAPLIFNDDINSILKEYQEACFRLEKAPADPPDLRYLSSKGILEIERRTYESIIELGPRVLWELPQQSNSKRVEQISK